MRRSLTPKLFVSITLLSIAGAAGNSAFAQPGADSAAPPPRHAQAGPGMEEAGDPTQRLRDRLESLDSEREQLRAALDRLDGGESWDEVRKDLFKGAERRMPRGPEGFRDGPDGESPDAMEREGRGRYDRFRGEFDETTTLEQLRHVDPEGADGYEEFAQRNPRFARRILQATAPRLMMLSELEAKDPELYRVEAELFRIDRQIMHTARSMHAAIAGDQAAEEAPSIDATRARLTDLVTRQVDLQNEGQRLKLRAAEERLDQLREDTANEAASRDAIITDRVDRIMERAVRTGVDRRERGGDWRSGRPGRGAGADDAPAERPGRRGSREF